MPIIKSHLIRIYERRRGYSLYVGTPAAGLTREPLDHESKRVSQSYLTAQARLDKVLQTKRVPWTLTFRLDQPKSAPVVAYGSLMELPAKDGHAGVVFLHAVELDGPDSLHACVSGVVTFLSNAGIRELRRIVLEAATDKVEASAAVALVADQFETIVAASPAFHGWRQDERMSIKSIEQDCAGAASVAWLTFALQQTRARVPWEVYDVVGNDGNVITAASGNYEENVRASELQRESLYHYLGRPEQPAARPEPPPTSVPLPSDVADKDSDESTHPSAAKPADTVAEPEQPFELRGVRKVLSVPASAVPAILILTFGLLFVYDSNRRHKEILSVLNKIEDGVALLQSATGRQPAPRPVATQPVQPSLLFTQCEPQLQQAITDLFSPDRNVRLAAIDRLQGDTASHAVLIPPTISYAREHLDNVNGLENTLLVFEKIAPATLQNNKELILSYIEVVKGTSAGANAAAARLSAKLNESTANTE